MPVWNAREECLEPEERAQLQLERLQSTLNRAYKNVPFYRNRLQENGIEPAQVETISALPHIPFTVRDDLSENYPYGLFAVPLRDVVRIHTAQGSVLKPTVSGFTKQDLGVSRELVARALFAAGVAKNDILQIDLDSGLINWGRAYKDGAEAIESSVIPQTILTPEKQLMLLRDYKTSVLISSHAAATQMMQLAFRANLNPNELALKTIILVGEPSDPETRTRLEEELHVKTWLHYGLSEVPGAALAFECEARQGLHVSEDHFFAEVITPGSGNAVMEGEAGELVLTTLTTRAFPLVRFRTGDLVRFLPGTCSCGRTLARIEWLPARTDELMVIRGVKLHPQQLVYLLERTMGFLPDAYRFLIRNEDLRDFLEVWLKVDEAVFSDEVKEMEKLCLRLARELTQELGVPVKIRLKEEGSFPSSQLSCCIEDLRTPADGRS
jgi:phenylacetate-CoA ligase